MTHVTVEEAVRVLCPLKASAYGSRGCSGPACMMWRWGRGPIRATIPCEGKDRDATVAPPRPGSVPFGWTFQPAEDGDPAFWMEPDREYAARCRGFCGLAGEPDYSGPGA